MNKYEYNDITNTLAIDPQFINLGIDYAISSNINSICIKPLNSYVEYGFNRPEQLYTFHLDSKCFKNAYNIEKLSITDYIKINKENLDDLYSLANMKDLTILSTSFNIDFSYLPQLKRLVLKYNKKVANINSLINLKDLLIFSFTEKDCRLLSDLESLELFRLIRGNYQSLNGIERLHNIRKIILAYNNLVNDISKVNLLTKLKRIEIEKCKQLSDLSILSNNESIQELFVDSVNSLKFIENMPNLNSINFWNCVDGDLSVLLNAKRLKTVSFNPNRKYYSHTVDEIRKIIKNKYVINNL